MQATPDSLPSRLHWEDFPVGLVIECGSRTVQREEILAFARDFDPQPFHVDEAAARESLFGGLSASGWHTCALTMRLMCDAYLLRSSSLGSPGLDEVRWLRPVHPGDTLHVRMTVLEARLMRSRPGVGLVRSQWESLDQDGQAVLRMIGWGMFACRQAAPAPAAA